MQYKHYVIRLLNVNNSRTRNMALPLSNINNQNQPLSYVSSSTVVLFVTLKIRQYFVLTFSVYLQYFRISIHAFIVFYLPLCHIKKIQESLISIHFKCLISFPFYFEFL